MQLERTQAGGLGIRDRFLAIAVLVLAVAGVTISLVVNSGTASRPVQPSGVAKASPPALALTSFAGYAGAPALPGASRLAVKAIASAGGERLAVGSADGYPAIWKQAPAGSWILVTKPGDLPAQSAPETLTTVAHGPAGWIAVGVPGPVVLTSANGTTWRPAAGNITADLGKITAVSAAAGPRGYVILGRLAVPGGACVADVWWSPDLASWKQAHDVNGTTGSSQTLAVAALTDGFVSVGSHNGKPAAWVTSNGTTWRTIFLSGPANAQLNQIAVIGKRVVATGGSDGQGTGSAAFAVSSPDGGATWQQADLQLPAPGTVVTALAGGTQGWIAAGRYGTPARPRVVVWKLAPGASRWAQAKVSGITGPGTGKTPEVTALAVSQEAVTGIGPVAPALNRQVAVFTLPAR
ncbi:MAG: hypothetical protein ABSB59_38520 [Streptosporangiaceae bacterium]|jgi:hypothetical protein